MSIPWPNEYAGLKEKVFQDWKVDPNRGIQIIREFSEGKSTARVFRVDIASERYDGQAILKLDTPQSWSPDDKTEAERHHEAEEHNSAFASDSLPRFIAECEHDDQIALLTSIAGGSFILVQPFVQLGHDQQLDSIKYISRAILDKWNSDYDLSEPAGSPRRALTGWLGYRLYKEEGGYIEDFVSDVFGISIESMSFSFDDEWFPNPLSFAITEKAWPSDHIIKFIKGRIHGDMHGRNVLVKIEDPAHDSFFLIDLALYQSDAYLFYDHAYLELSYLLEKRGNLTYPRWKEILAVLASPDIFGKGYSKVEPEDAGILGLIKAMREEIGSWCKKAEEPRGRFDDLKGQALLARVAAGLNFVNKPKLEPHKRKLAFLYAAAHLSRYLKTFNLRWEKKGPIVQLEDRIRPPQNDQWRKVWDACNHFDQHQSLFILIVGRGINAMGAEDCSVLGNIPWSLVLDFDEESKKDGLLKSVRPVLERHRSIHEVLIDNVRNINFKNSTCWFLANGTENRVDIHFEDYISWRRAYGEPISKLIREIHQEHTPFPVNVLILPDGIRDDMLRVAWERLDDILQDEARYVVVSGEDKPAFLNDELSGLTSIRCPLGDLLSGFWKMYGNIAEGEQVLIPARSEENGDNRKLIALSQKDYQYVSEDLEVVHPGLAAPGSEQHKIGLDFWRGHEISWGEVDLGVDVHRDMTSDLQEKITTYLKEGLKDVRNELITLAHEPGAGGTTIAKRVAWNLKGRYPTVFVRNLSSQTASRIETLYQLTGRLSIFVIIESADVPYASRNNLFSELRFNRVRAVLLYISRALVPDGKFAVRTPLESGDAKRFYTHYKNLASIGTKSALDELMNNPSLRRYRSPFFFGLYAFDKHFIRVPDYVAAHTGNLAAQPRKLLNYLALITRYSQGTSIRNVDMKGILGLSKESSLRLQDVFGDAALRLILYRDNSSRIIHPLLAQEILIQNLQDVGSTYSDLWRSHIADLCCNFIADMVGVRGGNSDEIWELFEQLFISRDPYENDSDRKLFSELINVIPNDEGQHRVFAQLTDYCPGNPHFWNHLGRHHMYAMKSALSIAESCLLQAIKLNEKDDIHYHTLGNIYRIEIDRKLRIKIRERGTATEGLDEVRELIEQASEKFAESRRLSPDSAYGYVTHIQLLTKTITDLYQLSGAEDYASFLTKVNDAAEWSRKKLHEAEDMLRQISDIQSQQKPSSYVESCRVTIQTFYEGGFADMIVSLKNLLDRADIVPTSIRRTAANAYFSHAKYSWSNLRAKHLRVVFDLMNDNLKSLAYDRRDIWMWFQAYRRLRDFDMLRAIDELQTWALREESSEPHYYLYILYFIRWNQGILADYRRVEQHLRDCKIFAKGLRTTFSYEWWAKGPNHCPLLHYRELEWNDEKHFFRNPEALQRLNGEIKHINGPQSGQIGLGPFEVFFIPGNEFRADRDEGVEVDFFVGFSYEGLRAWSVNRVT